MKNEERKKHDEKIWFVFYANTQFQSQFFFCIFFSSACLVFFVLPFFHFSLNGIFNEFVDVACATLKCPVVNTKKKKNILILNFSFFFLEKKNPELVLASFVKRWKWKKSWNFKFFITREFTEIKLQGCRWWLWHWCQRHG